uniref:Uncharacterized protein n=1 Tax=Trichobilharzia regenti TaxID=157069 RepID=A0AA85J725_TRIRE|nr:unnamed protein product [Trichobilharzia regenti]
MPETSMFTLHQRIFQHCVIYLNKQSDIDLHSNSVSKFPLCGGWYFRGELMNHKFLYNFITDKMIELNDCFSFRSDIVNILQSVSKENNPKMFDAMDCYTTL